MRLVAMLDIETLSTAHEAAILSIGAVKVDLEAPQDAPFTDEFRVGITTDSYAIYSQPALMPFAIDAATFAWWMSEERAAGRAAWNALDKVDLATALDAFGTWYNGAPDPADGTVLPMRPAEVWCFGATFDAPIMQHAFTVYGIGCPWKFRDVRCHRTVEALFGDLFPWDRETKVTHDALDDARLQAHRLRAMLQLSGAVYTQSPRVKVKAAAKPTIETLRKRLHEEENDPLGIDPLAVSQARRALREAEMAGGDDLGKDGDPLPARAGTDRLGQS